MYVSEKIVQRTLCKNCLAVGADHAFLVSDDAFKGSDTTGIANILKKCDRKIRSGQWSEI